MPPSRGALRSAILEVVRRPEVPQDALASYRRERLSECFVPVSFALMEGGFVGVIADKTFHAHPALLALISAAPMFGNLSSVWWARLAQLRRKIPLLVALQATLALLVGAVCVLPEGRLGAGSLALLVIAARLLIAGFLTVRSHVWTLNYPADVRARITSRLTLLGSLVMASTSLLGGLALDARPESFGQLYAGGALITLAGALAYGRVQLRGEESRGRPAAAPPAAASREAWRILGEDPVYARYLFWQFLLGTSNMMLEAPVLFLVSRQLQASYAVSIALTVVIPLALGMLTMPIWAAYLDRVHVARFRARHSWLWVLSQALTGIGALSGSLLWIGVGRVVLGFARGGGTLAWQIGHNHFAPPERAGLYMGVHATLTGVRGAVAPFLGMLLYLGWGEHPLGGGVSLPAFEGVGAGLMGICAMLGSVATLGFASLHRALFAER